MSLMFLKERWLIMMTKSYREYIKKHGLLDILDLFEYKLTAITRATALMELRRTVNLELNQVGGLRIYLHDLAPQNWRNIFLKFRNYLEFEVKEIK